ncbi:MAG: hypothetical protein SVM80_12940 [Halobacteriota archaeon]|jgi:hypothetical protein|nr:hypothetical protein [Halobacteriota archaeon]
MKSKTALLITVMTLLIVSSVGCIEINTPDAPSARPTQVERITVSGVEETTEIHSDNLVKLVISGVQNTVTVSQTTIVTDITMSGIDNTLYIPSSTNARVTDSGIDNEIIRY